MGQLSQAVISCPLCGHDQLPPDATFCPFCARRLPAVRPTLDFSAQIAESTRGFAGRGWIFREIGTWLADTKAPRVFLITGEAGSGKTALAARLVQFSGGATAPPPEAHTLRPGFLDAYHFCAAKQPDWISPNAYAESLAYQLQRHRECAATIAALTDPAHAQGRGQITVVRQEIGEIGDSSLAIGNLTWIAHLDARDVVPEDAYRRLVASPVTAYFQAHPAARILILVDALDEARRYSGQVGIVDMLAWAASLPTGARFVLTTRPEGDVLQSIRSLGAEEVSLSAGQWVAEIMADVSQYVLGALEQRPGLASLLAPGFAPEEFARLAASRAQGSFFRASEEIDKLVAEGRIIRAKDLEPRPVPLETYFLQGLRRLTGGDLEAWEQKHEPVLGTLAVAQESLKESQIAVILGRHRSQVRRVLTRLLPFLDRAESVPASRRLYTLIHQAFARFLLDEDAAEEYWCEAPLQHGRIAAYIQSCAGDWSGCDPYCLEYAAYHFIQAGWADELERILTKEFSDASSQVMGWHMPFVRNLEQALGVIGPERAARLCVEVIVGTRPNSLVNQRILYLLAGRIRPALQARDASLVRPGFEKDRVIEEALAWLEPSVPAESAVKALERLYARAKGPVRGFIGLALGATHSPLATPLLVEALGREERGIGWCIADALLDLGDRSVIPILIAEYGQPGAKPGHQTRILYVLGRMRATEAREAGLIEVGLTHRSRFARARAADMLWLLAPVPGAEAILWGRLGFSPEGPASDTAPAETQEYVLHRLVTALGRIGTEQSVAHLQRFRAQTIPRRPVPKTKDGRRERGRLEQSLDRAIHALENRYPGLPDSSQESG